MHTHMCYGDFGDIVPLWSDSGVDVASIEFSRSKDDSYIRQFYELFEDGHLQMDRACSTSTRRIPLDATRWTSGSATLSHSWPLPTCG